MATYQVLYWQDIPSLVEAHDGTNGHKEQLSLQFQELIDLVATKKDIVGSDAYLEEWRKGSPEQRAGTPEEVVKAVASEFESRFDAIRAEALAKCGAN
jgi:DNA phosphorothioation-dependent restriction protein DptG